MLKKTIIKVFIVLIIFIVAIIGNYCYGKVQNNQEKQSLVKEIKDGDNIQWRKDMIGWLETDYTSEPIMTGEYYKNHLYNKKENNNGSVYVYEGEDFTDQNTIIYCNHVEDTKKFVIYFPSGEKRYYKVFRTAFNTNSDNPIYKTKFESEDEFNEYLNTNPFSDRNIDVPVKYVDRIITLTTDKEKRDIIQAVEEKIEFTRKNTSE